MKQLSTAVILLVGLTTNAQSTFRIYDTMMNDVTSGNVFLLDTNSSMMSVTLWVQNTDSITHNVQAARIIISQPPAASNAFIWGMYQYAPNVDTSAMPVTIAPAAMDTFVGYYFPDTLNGVATINYCFWETTNPNNSSCVTVYYENHMHVGIRPTDASTFSLVPNPAGEFMDVTWADFNCEVIQVFASDGRLVQSNPVSPAQNNFRIQLQSLPPGIYMVQLIGRGGEVWTQSLVH